MDELLELLLSEFELDVPSAQLSMDAARADPANAQEHLADTIDFIHRTLQASEVAGLDGLSQWLQCVHACVESAMHSGDPALLGWLPDWVDLTRIYLQRPAHPESVAALTGFICACPIAEVNALADELSDALAVAPTTHDDSLEQESIEAVTLDDVSLASEDADPDLLGAMLVDAPEQLERLRGFVQRIDKPGMTPEMLVEAQRIAHTLKGSGNIVGIVGIGRMSHFLENVLEWALLCARTGEPFNVFAVRDLTQAVETLQQMVGFLQGEEEAPLHALAVLERLAQWSRGIRLHEADSMAPEPVAIGRYVAADDMGERFESTYLTGERIGQEPDTPAAPTSGNAGQTVRVDAERLSRLLRRAGQSIFVSQRLQGFLTRARTELQASLLKQRELEARLREMQSYVDRQVVNLRSQRDAGADFDPLEMDRYDSMYSLSRFIAEDVSDQHELASGAMLQIERAQDAMRDERGQLTLQHRELLSARMVAVKSVVPRLRRNVQQTAASTHKSVELIFSGENTTIDANVLTRLTEPLLHLVRNAVDHGIEPPEKRIAAGKEAIGRVYVEFRAVGQDVEVICRDDGRGLDAYAIHQKAIEYGIVSDNQGLTPSQIFNFVLLPGFSTKKEISEISGRGVGLDVVNDRVIAMKGKVSIASEAGQGTTFTLRVPMSTGSANVLVVDVAEQLVALPIEGVSQALAPDCFVRDGDAIMLDGRRVPARTLAHELGFEPLDPLLESRAPSAVLINVLGDDVALLVDAILDVREVVLQDAGALLRRIPGVAAAALRDDGQPLLVLDLAGVLSARTSMTAQSAAAHMRRRAALVRTRVMVVDDALSVRRAMSQLLVDAGYDVSECKDGQEAVERLRVQLPAVVLTDLEMPVLNGIELTQRIRGNTAWAHLPVVMITSRASEKHRTLAQNAGVDVFLTKPFDDADLIEHVRHLAHGRDVVDAEAIAEPLKQ